MMLNPDKIRQMKCCWLVATLCGTLAWAQVAPPAGKDKIDPALKAEIRGLLVTMHLDDVLREQLKTSIPPMIDVMKQNPAVTPQFADEFAKQFEAQILSTHELTDMIVEAYAHRFTLSEVKNLQAFYRSPTGRKMVETQPELMSEVSKKAGAFGQALAMQLTDKIVRDHPEYVRKKDGTEATPPPAPAPPSAK